MKCIYFSHFAYYMHMLDLIHRLHILLLHLEIYKSLYLRIFLMMYLSYKMNYHILNKNIHTYHLQIISENISAVVLVINVSKFDPLYTWFLIVNLIISESMVIPLLDPAYPLMLYIHCCIILNLPLYAGLNLPLKMFELIVFVVRPVSITQWPPYILLVK